MNFARLSSPWRCCAVPIQCAPLWLAGCSRSPAQDIFGSFFPAWLLCVGIGVLAAAAAHRLLALAQVAAHVPLAPLTWAAFATCVTLLAWWLWVGA